MKTLIKKILAIFIVLTLIIGITTVVYAANGYNVNNDTDTNGNEVIDICDLVAAEMQDKSNSFVEKLGRIILEIEELPTESSGPKKSGGIYLPLAP